MKTNTRIWIYSIAFLFISQISYSQFNIGADVASRYLWRGQLLATGPVIQPSINYTAGNLEIGAWGSYGFDGFDGTEADIYLTYSMGDFSATLTDYFFPSDGTGPDFDNYFDYSDSTTAHVLEFMLSWDPESSPFSVTAAYDFYGADPDDSFYAEIGYSIGDDTDLFIQAGNGWYTYETSGDEDSFGLVGIGLTHNKELKITESYSLPVFGTIVINPESEKLFLVFGLKF